MTLDKAEEKAIKKRKHKARRVHTAYQLMRIFPIRENKIVFNTFEGDGGFCCNPRYIAEELLRRGEKYEMIWLVNDMSREFPKGIRKVKNTFWNRVYHLATAKVWISNTRKEYGTAKRKGQLYIQTWHAGIALKPVGKYRGKLFPKIACLVSAYDSGLADLVTSNSDWCTRVYPKMLLYKGKILKTGSPRCDVFYTKREELHKAIRDRYGVPRDAKIVMFAPTFRGGGQRGKRQVFAEIPTLDFELLTEALQKKFGGEWYIFLRLHPQLSAQLAGMPMNNKTEHMVDVSQADDINELLAATDVLISDYSSTPFDVINIYMPVFLYADDFEEYVKDRGSLMWNIKNLPFPFAQTNAELAENISQFDEETYREKIDIFSQEQGVLEDGHASERVADYLEGQLAL